MADEQPITSKRDSVSKRLKERYPDREFADDEAMYSQIYDDYDQYDRDLADRDNQISEYRERENKLSGMMASDPRAASLLMGMKDGEDPAIGLMRRFGPELRDFLDDPENQEQLAQAQAEYLERITKEHDLTELYEQNLEQSIKDIEQYQQQAGLSDEQIDQLMQDIIAVGNDMIVGKFTVETLKLFGRARNYEADVKAAADEGEIRGKNTRITEQLRRPSQGDGTPALDGKNGDAVGARNAPSLGALDNYDSSTNSIWERGGARRTSRR